MRESTRTHRRGSLLRTRGPLVAAATALALVAAACGGSDDGDAAAPEEEGEEAADELPDPADWEPEWVDGQLQPLANGWPSEDITFAIRGAPGSRNDLWMRDIAAAIENNGLSPVGIQLEEEPHDAHSSWGALRALNERAPDGSVLTVVSVAGTISSYMVEDIPAVEGIDMDGFQLATVLEAQPYVVIQRLDAPWGNSFEALVEYARENPGEVRYTVNSHGGGLDLSMNSILLELGIDIEAGDMQKIIAGGHQEGATNVGSGEADFTISMVEIAQQHFEAGRVVPIFTTADEVMAPFDELEWMVSASDIGVTEFWNTDLGLAVGADTPELHKWWLYELMREAHLQDEYQRRTDIVPGVQIGALNPDESAALKEFLIGLTDNVTRNLGLHHEVAS